MLAVRTVAVLAGVGLGWTSLTTVIFGGFTGLTLAYVIAVLGFWLAEAITGFALCVFGVTWAWIKGHAGHPENERADELARGGMAPFKPARAAG